MGSKYHTHLRIPPVLAYVDVDYFEQLLEVEGLARVNDQPVPIQGVGKLDYN